MCSSFCPHYNALLHFGQMVPDRILSVNASIDIIGEILLKIIPTLEEVSWHPNYPLNCVYRRDVFKPFRSSWEPAPVTLQASRFTGLSRFEGFFLSCNILVSNSRNSLTKCRTSWDLFDITDLLLCFCSTNITAELILTVSSGCWSIRAWQGASLGWKVPR